MKISDALRDHIAAHPLSGEELHALHRAKRGFVIDDHHYDKLRGLGLMREAVGGPMLTDLGIARILVEHGS